MQSGEALTRRTLLGRAAGAGAASAIAPPLAGASVASLIGAPDAGAAALHDAARVSARSLGTLAGESSTIAARRRFELVGLRWEGPASARIELRARTREGAWSRWVRASVLGHDGDGEGLRNGLFGEPLWAGAADYVQLRTSQPVSAVQLQFVEIAVSGAGGGTGAPRALDAGVQNPDARAAAALPLAAPLLAAGPGAPPIIARVAWSQGAPPASAPSYGDVRLAFVHHTDNLNGYSAAEVPAMLYAMYLFHRYVRGWRDIGYNFVIDAFGRIWEARAGGIDQAVIGAQAGGYNLESTGVAILGTYSGVLPSAAARAALERLLAWKLSLHGVPIAGQVTVEVNPSDAVYTPFAPGARVSLPRVAGHRDGCTTDCPGDALYAYLPQVRAATARLAGRQRAVTLALAGGEAVAATALSLATSASVAGVPLRASGLLATLAGGPIPAATIELQQLTVSAAGVASERTLARALTASDGTWSASLMPLSNMLVRALCSSAPVTASPLRLVAVAPAISLAPVPYPPPADAREQLLAGSITPHKPLVTVTVQRAGHPKPVATKSVRVVGGRFQLALKLGAGVWWLRAQSAADPSNLAGASPRLVLRV
jgi:hypothetical protein